MKRKLLFLVLLVGAALAPQKLVAQTCYQSYLYCLNHCTTQTCRDNCIDAYNACRFF